jgi:hypothetical protein
MKIITDSFQLAVYRKGNEDADKLALVLPGRLDTKDYPHMRSHVDFLARRGYLALSFDPPGTWETDGDIALYSMTNYLLAINELITYFRNRPTFVLGHSRGGSMAMLAGVTNEYVSRFGAIMSWYSYDPKMYSTPVDSEWKSTGFKPSKRDLPNEPQKSRVFKLPYSFFEDQQQYDMSKGLKESSKPKLFILGKNDETVDPDIVREAYFQASDPKMLFELESDHNYRFHNHLIEEVNHMVGKFLDKYENS